MPTANDANASSTLSASAEPKPNTRRQALLGCAFILGAVALVGGGGAAFYFTAKAGGETLVRMPVADIPTTVTFELTAAKAVTLWTDLDVKHRGIDKTTANQNLPHVVDYVIVVTRDGAPLANLTCNPFESNFAKTSSQSGALNDEGRSYDGRLSPNCAFEAPPGRYTLTAHREWRTKDERIVLRKTDLIVRGE